MEIRFTQLQELAGCDRKRYVTLPRRLEHFEALSHQSAAQLQVTVWMPQKVSGPGEHSASVRDMGQYVRPGFGVCHEQRLSPVDQQPCGLQDPGISELCST
ncbi:hypothetical protein [Streptomyces sp. LN549]|uniref:hypothetical protein n=1 Tax=Streptomyces sp. LN549 TaxID=3112979 RepID=UPI003718F1D8